jgi:hypothetical protein
LIADFSVLHSKNSVECIECVQKTYNHHYPHGMINRIFITLQTVFNQIIEDYGGNNYKIPHLNKNLLEKEDRLPIAVEVTAAATEYL